MGSAQQETIRKKSDLRRGDTFNGLMESTKRGKKKVDLLHDGGEGPTFIHRAGILIRGMTSQLYHIDIIMISLITSSLHHTSVWYDVSMT